MNRAEMAPYQALVVYDLRAFCTVLFHPVEIKFGLFPLSYN